jgi:hypothetical protein
MKLKHELVSKINLTLTGTKEIEAFENSDFYYMEKVSTSHDLINQKMDVVAYIKMSEFPKLQRFVRNFNSKK